MAPVKPGIYAINRAIIFSVSLDPCIGLFNVIVGYSRCIAID